MVQWRFSEVDTEELLRCSAKNQIFAAIMNKDQLPEEQSEKRENFWLSIGGLIVFLSVVTFIWAIYGGIVRNLPIDWEVRGQSGDMFGGITALFSGLAFAGLIFALLVQKEELRAQHKELARLVDEQKQTSEHLSGQREQLELQSRFISQQIFESNFFQILEGFGAFVASIATGTSARTYNGQDALERIYYSMRKHMTNAMADPDMEFDDAYEQFYIKNKNDLGPYFRLIYNILKYIENSDTKDKKFYSNILRARLSSAELSLLFVNGASRYGSNKMAPLMKKYDLLKHFDDQSVTKYSKSIQHKYEDWDFYVKSNLTW